MQKIVAVFRLIRPLNCIILGFAVLVGVIVATDGRFSEGTLFVQSLLSFITGFTFLGAANTVNDYYDRSIDKINEPSRPIPSGAVSPNEALGYVAALSFIGFIAAFFTSTTNFANLAIAFVAWFLFIYYATKGKRAGIFGNFIVSACVAIPFIYGGFAVDKGLTLLLVLFSAMAFFSTLGREVTKGIVDTHGDKLQGVKTASILYGPRNAALIADVFYVVAVVISVVPLFLSKVSFWYIPAVVLADAGFLLSAVSLLLNYSRDNARRVKNLARLWMVVGLFAFIAGVLG